MHGSDSIFISQNMELYFEGSKTIVIIVNLNVIEAVSVRLCVLHCTVYTTALPDSHRGAE